MILVVIFSNQHAMVTINIVYSPKGLLWLIESVIIELKFVATFNKPDCH